MTATVHVFQPLNGASPIELPTKAEVAAQDLKEAAVEDSTPATIDPLEMTESAMYGYAALLAKSLNAPLNHAYCTLLTMFCGVGVKVKTEGYEPIVPRLYTALLGPPSEGKSHTIERAKRAILHNKSYLHEYWLKKKNLNSDRALDVAFPGYSLREDAKSRKEKNAMVKHEAPSCCVYQEEMSILMTKAQYQGTCLAPMFCDLYYNDEAENTTAKGEFSCAVKLNYLGNLATDDADHFREYFTDTTKSGFYDRFIFAPPPQKWEWDYIWSPTKIECKTGNEVDDAYLRRFDADEPMNSENIVTVQPPDFEPIDAWAKEYYHDHKKNRIPEIMKRVAIITASINNDDHLTPECVAAALEFGKWQARVREVYNPSAAKNPAAMAVNAILDAYGRIAKRDPERYVRFRDLSRKHNWHGKYGPLITQAKKCLVDDGMLQAELIADEFPTGRYRITTVLPSEPKAAKAAKRKKGKEVARCLIWPPSTVITTSR